MRCQQVMVLGTAALVRGKYVAKSSLYIRLEAEPVCPLALVH
jgi:hypothetical protein